MGGVTLAVSWTAAVAELLLLPLSPFGAETFS